MENECSIYNRASATAFSLLVHSYGIGREGKIHKKTMAHLKLHTVLQSRAHANNRVFNTTLSEEATMRYYCIYNLQIQLHLRHKNQAYDAEIKLEFDVLPCIFQL